ncbi:MAG: insulinase family protein [Planctomycetota bacterium]|nr:insulinase family protein [Planctomycetota bacterium]
MRRFSQALAISLAAVLSPVVLLADTPLPTDPRLVTGEFGNGMKYIVLNHATPPGRACIYLHVSTGSLNETRDIAGISHYLEHMAFNGSKNFPPNSVIKFFEGMGLTFGRHQNAGTGLDQTYYQLELPDNKTETLEKGMLFLSDVAMRLSFLPEEIDAERGIILQEKRTRLGAQQRVQEYVFKRMLPGSTIGEWLPIGTEETINGVQQEQFKKYYSTWYTPSNMTLIIVADGDPKTLVEMATKNFDEGEKKPRPVDRDMNVKPYEKSRAIVASDEELTEASVSFMRVGPARPPATTVETARAELVDQMATAAFNRRIEKKISQGKMAFLDAGASAGNLFNAAQNFEVQASGEPSKWKQILADLGTEVQRARIHGFSAQEIDDVKKQFISGAEQAVKTESTRQASQVIRILNSQVNRGETIMSAKQELDLLNQQITGITPQEISEVFAKGFDPSKVTFIAELPKSADVPSEEQLVELGTKAFSVTPDAEKDEARATALLEKLPTPGSVMEQSNHAATGVTSAWLSNGVRVHHRFMDYKKDTASVLISLAGGELLEDTKTRGLTEAAAIAWSKPATQNLTSTQIRDLMTGKKVDVRGMAQPDAMMVSVNGNPAELETGMQLAYLLLTKPKIEEAAFTQWQTESLQRLEMMAKMPQGVLSRLIPQAVFPEGEVRTRPIVAEEVKAVTLASAQKWLEQQISTAPIEVSIVGDIKLEQAMELANKYLGALPTRERISDKTFDDKRVIKHPAGPRVATAKLETKTPQAVALAGFYTCDADNVADTRAMNLAQQIISTRMIAEIREKRNLVYSIGARNQPAATYPGFGVFYAVAPTKPETADELATVINSMYEDFAKTGPTEEELVTAKKQRANTLDEGMKDPSFWSRATQTMDYRGTKLDDVAADPEEYQKVTAEQIKTTFNKYYGADKTVRVVVIPDVPAGASMDAAGTATAPGNAPAPVQVPAPKPAGK